MLKSHLANLDIEDVRGTKTNYVGSHKYKATHKHLG